MSLLTSQNIMFSSVNFLSKILYINKSCLSAIIFHQPTLTAIAHFHDPTVRAPEQISGTLPTKEEKTLFRPGPHHRDVDPNFRHKIRRYEYVVQDVDVETSIRYMSSNGYKLIYGDEPVWVKYKRNYKGARPPAKTRRSCIMKNYMNTGNPCPICRDEYLVVHYKNTDLLKQFVSSYTGEILPYSKTGLCRKAHSNVLVAVMQAKDQGLLTYDNIPYRYYNYKDYYSIPEENNEEFEEEEMEN